MIRKFLCVAILIPLEYVILKWVSIDQIIILLGLPTMQCNMLIVGNEEERDASIVNIR